MVYVCSYIISLLILQDVAVRSKDFVGSLIEFNQRFKCADSSHGKIVMRESEVISEEVDAIQHHERKKKASIQGSSIIDAHMLGHAHAQFKGDQRTVPQMAEQSEAVNTTGINREQQIRQFKKVSLPWPNRSYELVSCIKSACNLKFVYINPAQQQ